MKALNLVLVSFLSILVAASPLRAGVRSPLTTRGSYAEGQVSFDQYSLSINGERVFLQSVSRQSFTILNVQIAHI